MKSSKVKSSKNLKTTNEAEKLQLDHATTSSKLKKNKVKKKDWRMEEKFQKLCNMIETTQNKAHTSSDLPSKSTQETDVDSYNTEENKLLKLYKYERLFRKINKRMFGTSKIRPLNYRKTKKKQTKLKMSDHQFKKVQYKPKAMNSSYSTLSTSAITLQDVDDNDMAKYMSWKCLNDQQFAYRITKNQYQCFVNECNEILESKNMLHIHVVDVHEAERYRCICKQCDKNHYPLKNVTKYMFTGKFICVSCCKKFTALDYYSHACDEKRKRCTPVHHIEVLNLAVKKEDDQENIQCYMSEAKRESILNWLNNIEVDKIITDSES